MKRLKGKRVYCDEPTGRWYELRISRKVNGETEERRVYGELEDCEHCGMKFFRPRSVKSMLCSASCRAKVKKAKARAARKVSPSAKKTEADRLFSLIVRSAGYCQLAVLASDKCKGPLQCAHIYSRSFLAIRWDERNARAGCAGHHLYYTGRPDEWEDWRQDQLPPDVYKALRVEKYGPNPDIDEVLATLRARWAEIESEAA